MTAQELAAPELAVDIAAARARNSYKWKVLASVIFGIFMATLDTTAVNVAFPTLRLEFGATLRDSQWIVSIYVLALGIPKPVAGFLADRYGIKRIYLVGLATFTVGSVLAGIAPTLWALVIARAVQGIGGGMAIPLGTAMLFTTFSKTELGLALGVFGLALLFAPAMGPVLAGVLIDHNHWRWIFFINLPIGALGIVLGSRFLKENRRESKATWDTIGIGTAVVGFGATLYGASIVAEVGWTSAQVLAAFGIGALGLAAFAMNEIFLARDPLLDLRLFRRRVFLVATLVGYVTVIAFFGAEFLLPVYLQALRGRPALDAGLALLPLALVAGLTLPVAGKIYDMIGPRSLVVAGFCLLAFDTWALSALGSDTSMRWIVMLMIVRGLALGLTVQTPFTAALADVGPEAIARGTSLVSSTRYVTQAIGVAVLATVLASTITPGVRALQRDMTRLPERHATSLGLCEIDHPQPLARPSSGARTIASSAGNWETGPSTPACVESLGGFSRAYRLTFYLSLVALMLGFLLPGWPGKAHV
ncbi:MAG: DHA2 family efflux MFS transporter permease subunit [Gemmatimonadaceae bacterium]